MEKRVRFLVRPSGVTVRCELFESSTLRTVDELRILYFLFGIWFLSSKMDEVGLWRYQYSKARFSCLGGGGGGFIVLLPSNSTDPYENDI